MRKKVVLNRVFSIILMLLTLTTLSCEQTLNEPIGNWSQRMGSGYGAEYMWFILLVLISLVAFFLFRILKSKDFDGSIIEKPAAILKRRYAKGEIDKKKFRRSEKGPQS